MAKNRKQAESEVHLGSVADAPVPAVETETPVPPSNGSGPGKKKKTVCPVTRAQFRSKAQPLSVTLQGKPMVGDVKEFSTGSLGWNINGRITLEIDGVKVQAQVGCNIALIGSKDLPAS